MDELMALNVEELKENSNQASLDFLEMLKKFGMLVLEKTTIHC